MTQVSFRLDDETVARIDAHAARLASKTPGIEYTRVDAARALLATALDLAEAEAEHTGSERTAPPRARRGRAAP